MVARRRARSARVAAGLLVLSAAAAGAQDPEGPDRSEPGPTVAQRRRPELEPLGVRLGSFLLLPRVGFAVEANDNIFARDADRESDLVAVASPGLVARSDWERHFARLALGADLGRYRDFPQEDYDDWSVSGDGLVRLADPARLLLGAAVAGLHQPRDSPDDRGGLAPTKYTSTTGFATFSYRPGRLQLEPAAVFNRLDFSSVPALVGGEIVEVEQDDRDRDEYTLTLEGGYRRGEGDRAFLRARSVARDYDQAQSVTGFDRSSDGFEVGGGVASDAAAVTVGSLYVGYRAQLYRDPLPDIREPVFEASLTWKASEITTVEVGARRDLRETTALLYSGYVSTSALLSVDHELRRSVLLSAVVQYDYDSYAGIGPAARVDRTYRVGAGVTWLASRHVVASVRYERSARDSTDEGLPGGLVSDDFGRNVGWVRIEIRQ